MTQQDGWSADGVAGRDEAPLGRGLPALPAEPPRTPPQPPWSEPPPLPYGYAVQPATPTSGLAVAALIVGLASLVLWWIPLVGWLLPVAAIAFGVVGINQTADGAQQGRGMAIAGVVLGSIALLLLVLLGILIFGLFGALSSL